MLNNSLKSLKGALTSYQYQRLMSITGIDLNKSVAINFTNEKYDKNTQSNDIFLFIKGKSLIGVLKGGAFDKDYKDVISWEAYRNINQNWKNLKLNAETILRVSKDQLTYNASRRNNRYRRQPSHKQLLQQRLEKYKASKNNNLSINDLKVMIQQSSQIITSLMLQPQNKQVEYMEGLKNILWWSSSTSNISVGFRTISDHMERLMRIENSLNDQPFGRDYINEQLDKLKVEIVDFNKILKSYN